MSTDIERALKLAFPGEDARYFSPMSIGNTPSSQRGRRRTSRLGRDQDDRLFGDREHLLNAHPVGETSLLSLRLC